MHIRIKGYTFTLSEPFTPGTVISKGEAQALNDLRAENIQNNLRKLVAEATAGLQPGELIPQPVLDEIQTKLTQYDRGYQFVEKHQPRPRLGDIESAAREIATERVDQGLRSADQPIDLEDPERIRLIEETAQLPAVLEAARDRVSARRRAVLGGLEDL